MCEGRDLEFHGFIGVNFNPDAPTSSTTAVLLITTIFVFHQHRLTILIIVSTRAPYILLHG
jgi:hypothetical protein